MSPNRDAQVRKVIAQISRKTAQIGPEDSLFDSGLIDSFALVDLVGALEREFGLQIPDSDLIPQKFESLSKIEAYLAVRLGE